MGIGTRSPKPRSGVVARTGRYAILCSGRQCVVETEGFQAAGHACIYAVARLLQAARRRFVCLSQKNKHMFDSQDNDSVV